MVMILLLLGNLTYVQVFKAGDYRTDPRNQRVLLEEYSRERGQISAGGQVLASSLATNDRLRFQRQYTGGPMYAPLTGFFSVVYNASGLEQVEDEVLNGSDDRLFVRRLSDLITGRDPSGGNVVLTIDPTVQKVAYDALTAKQSYDPSALADHNANVQKKAWTDYTQADPPVLINRAISATYPPGSTFKLVDVSAALQDGFTPDTPLPASSQITLPGTATRLENYAGTPCGAGPTATMADALARSCNTAFATLAEQVGEEKLRKQAEAFGIGEADEQIPLPVAPSSIGRIPDTPALMQSGIGQRDVRLTPLQNAEIVATIANGGSRMAPHLVKEIQAPDLSTLDTTQPQMINQAIPAGVASTITQLMIGSEDRTLGGGKISGVQIASKTGTAEHGANPKQTPPHAWYVAFAPAENPQVAVAVLVENGGNQALEATGGSVAAPIGRAVIASVLGGSSSAAGRTSGDGSPR
jgi:peptidoglycan glycosyltransferase